VRNLCIALAFVAIPAAAQWFDYPTPGIPRTKDGKPKLTAPTPRTSDGKPDFSGTWQADGEKYLDNLGADGVQIPMQPWAAKLYQERQRNYGKDRPSGRCLPHSVTDFDAHFTPRKVIQTPGEVAMLFEAYHTFRQIFTDGRPLPAIRDPGWFGFSVGKWEGDTLVVNTIGINDKTWLDGCVANRMRGSGLPSGGHPFSQICQAAMPNIRSMKRFWPTTSPFGNQRICPLRMMFMASYPAMELRAPSADRNP
jgi:hypothetical protein